jgi:PAS domain S-box-containing protein
MPGDWRWLEHTAWVLFENVFLIIIIRQSVLEMRDLARHTAEVETSMSAAEESERRFRGSFDQAAVGMAHCAPDGRWLRVNETLCRIVGYSRDEMLERGFNDLTHPDDQAGLADDVGQLLRGDVQHFTRKLRCFHKDGHALWAKVSMSLVRRHDEEPDYLNGVIEDISEARAAKEALLASHEEIRKLSLVASKARHPVIITDAEGRAEWANEAFTNLTEYALAELVGQKPWSFLQGPETDIHLLDSIDQRVAERKSVSAELVHYAKSGRAVWVSLEVDPVVDENGVVTNFIATQADITDRKQQESELRAAIAQSDAANKTKSQFLANMSHEIRTPLNGILGFTEMLLRDEHSTEEERREYLHTIDTSGKHLLMLINDVLDLSKIEAGQLQIERMPCSPHQIIAEVISILRVRAQDKGVTLEYRWESGIPETIETDPYRVKQLLMNLVGNAVKFTDRGCVMVVARLLAESGQLELEVRDTGVGIPQDKLNAIFDPFVQADNSVTRKHGGTGLGLAISRNIAEALGGGITASSEYGVGSTFRVLISAGNLENVTIMDKPPQAQPGDIAKTNADGIRLDGIRILLVDDGETNRRLLHILLSRRGAHVVTAENGLIAVQKAAEQFFDIVLMDMQMPVLDGYAATTRLRDNGFGKPIIALTAHAMKGDREKCEQAGCSGYLSKPIDMDKLLHLITDSIGATCPVRRGGESEEAARPAPAKQLEPIRSLLPTDDEELRAVVSDFVGALQSRMGAMRTAHGEDKLAELAGLAHWLKGAGGTVGFDCFTAPAARLESAAKAGERESVAATLRELQGLCDRVVV